MPAVSQAQQSLMGIAYCYKKGECPDASAEAKKLASQMTLQQLKDFAKTKHEGLPKHVAKEDFLDFDDFEKTLDEFEAVPGTSYSNLGNITGQGSVRPAAQVSSNGGSGSGVDLTGSGDRFDNFDDEDNDEEKKKKLKNKKKKELIDREKEKKEKETEENKRKQKGKMEGIYIDFDTFVNENVLLVSERLTAKRKYTSEHPAVTMNYEAPVRNKILSFIGEKGEVSKSEMEEYLKSLKEETGKRPNSGYLKDNRHLIKKVENESGVFYKLTDRGKTVLEKYKDFEKQNNNNN